MVATPAALMEAVREPEPAAQLLAHLRVRVWGACFGVICVCIHVCVCVSIPKFVLGGRNGKARFTKTRDKTMCGRRAAFGLPGFGLHSTPLTPPTPTLPLISHPPPNTHTHCLCAVFSLCSLTHTHTYIHTQVLAVDEVDECFSAFPSDMAELMATAAERGGAGNSNGEKPQVRVRAFTGDVRVGLWDCVDMCMRTCVEQRNGQRPAQMPE